MLDKMKQYKDANNGEEYITYLTNVGLMDYIVKSIEKDKDPMRRIENVNKLVKIAAGFDSLEEFYD